MEAPMYAGLHRCRDYSPLPQTLSSGARYAKLALSDFCFTPATYKVLQLGVLGWQVLGKRAQLALAGANFGGECFLGCVHCISLD
jgi:hypothetical protein